MLPSSRPKPSSKVLELMAGELRKLTCPREMETEVWVTPPELDSVYGDCRAACPSDNDCSVCPRWGAGKACGTTISVSTACKVGRFDERARTCVERSCPTGLQLVSFRYRKPLFTDYEDEPFRACVRCDRGQVDTRETEEWWHSQSVEKEFLLCRVGPTGTAPVVAAQAKRPFVEKAEALSGRLVALSARATGLRSANSGRADRNLDLAIRQALSVSFDCRDRLGQVLSPKYKGTVGEAEATIARCAALADRAETALPRK